MASIVVAKPFSLKTATVSIKPDGSSTASDFSDHISQIQFDPSTSSASWTSVSGKVIQENAAPTWAASLALVQDLDQAGLLRFLLTNQGKKATMDVTFKNGTDPAHISVTLSAASIGGTADGSVAQSSVTFPMDGAPTFTPAGA